jgi:hypothetical protein
VSTVSNDQNGLKKVIKRSKTVRNSHGTFRNGHANVHANGKERWTLNGQERLGKFESERNNALERIVENVHVHVSKTKELLYFLNIKIIKFKF